MWWGRSELAGLPDGKSGLSHADSGWEPQHAAGGHLGAVTDLAWLPNLPCLLTVSTDQTARIFGPCALPETESLTNSSAADTHSDAAEGQRWCEIARPQVGFSPLHYRVAQQSPAEKTEKRMGPELHPPGAVAGGTILKDVQVPLRISSRNRH